MILDLLSAALIAAGTFFFIAGTVGLLRFPDLYCRLHALTKADGLGLALVALGIALGADNAGQVVRIVLIWFFVALASATCSHLLATYARAADRERDA
jgi:multicomponent Na+:H+ antiporter subunit G